MNLRAQAFTIVELLIVIVVIGILATISVVAYNGIQNKAANTQVVNMVSSYQKALEMFRISGAGVQEYPHLEAGMVQNQCLGVGYTRNGGHCWDGPDSPAQESPALNALLSEWLPVPPKLSSPRYYAVGPNQRTGAIFIRGNYTGAEGTLPPRIQFLLNGANQDCTVSGSRRVAVGSNWSSSVTLCELMLNAKMIN